MIEHSCELFNWDKSIVQCLGGVALLRLPTERESGIVWKGEITRPPCDTCDGKNVKDPGGGLDDEKAFARCPTFPTIGTIMNKSSLEEL